MTGTKTKVVYGRLSEAKWIAFEGGKKAPLFSNWGELSINGTLFTFVHPTSTQLVDSRNELVGIVEEGNGIIRFNKKDYTIGNNHVFKVFPGQGFTVIPTDTLTVLFVDMPGSREKALHTGEMLDEIKVIDVAAIPGKVYEYESFGREIIVCGYSPGIGLLRFQFPIDRIPLHIHPHSGRLIRTMSGEGYTYVQPDRYRMDRDTFCLFDRGVAHTNGPKTGSLYDVYAVQLPWVDPKIDEEHIAGDPNFVRYVDAEPPKPLWKTKQDLERAIELHDRNKR